MILSSFRGEYGQTSSMPHTLEEFTYALHTYKFFLYRIVYFSRKGKGSLALKYNGKRGNKTFSKETIYFLVYRWLFTLILLEGSNSS